MRSSQVRFGFPRHISLEMSLVYPCTTFLQSASLSLRDTLKHVTLYEFILFWSVPMSSELSVN